MKKEMILGKPVCFFTELSYEQPEDREYDEESEENAEIYYEYKELKSGKTEFGVAFHNVPYYPADIPAVKDSLNVEEVSEGEYTVNKEIKYDDCLNAYKNMVDSGVPLTDITADTIIKSLQTKEVKTL